MAKTLTTAVQQEIAKDQNQPIHLITIELASQTLRYTDWDVDVEFPTGSGTIYSARGLSFDPVATSLSMEVDSVDISFDNVDRYFSNLLADNVFQGRYCTIEKTFANLLGDSNNAVTIFSGKISHPRVDQESFTIRVVSLLNSLNQEVPRRMFQAQCPWDFGGTECGLDITVSPYKETGTADSGSTDSVLVDSSRTEEDNWWQYGILKMTSGSNSGIRREVKESTSGQITVLHKFPYPIAAGDTYEIQVGCKKTFGECKDKYNNTDNFGGFPSVTRRVSS